MKNKISLIEAVDTQNNPLAFMNISEIHRQSLLHRSVCILIYNSEGKIFLRKRHRHKKRFPKRWDVSAGGHVYAGESTKGAALREIEHILNIKNGNLKFLEEIKASADTGNEFISIYVLDKINSIPNPNEEEVESGYFYSDSELEWLLKEYRELLSPGLVLLHDAGILFRTK